MKLLASLSFAMLVVACADSSDSSGAAGVGGMNGGPGGTGGTSDVSCGESNVCVGDPGSDWMGPFAVIDSSVGCGGAFPDTVDVRFQGLQAGTASCECTCGSATAVCSTNMRAIGFGQLGCNMGLGQHTLNENECYNTFSASHSVELRAASTSCGAGTVIASLPTPTWLRSVSVCGGFTAGTAPCDAEQTCVPKPGSSFDAGLCYVRQGDHECPIDFRSKALSYTGVSDTRDCADSCDCSGSGASCSVSVSRYTGQNCSSPQDVVTVSSGGTSCVVTDSTVIESIRLGDVEVVSDGMCSPAAIGVNGTVEGEGVATICCG